MHPHQSMRTALNKFRELREKKGITAEQIDDELSLGPGWTAQFESGESTPPLEMILAMLNIIEVEPAAFFSIIPKNQPIDVPRSFAIETTKDGIQLLFPYGKFNSSFLLKGATEEEADTLLKLFRTGLGKLVSTKDEDQGQAIQSDCVADVFLEAVKMWPDLNPADIWNFVVYRMYLDPFNHPAVNAKLNLDQSWRRTAGWALEKVLIRHYEDFLKSKGIGLVAGYDAKAIELAPQFQIKERLELAKIDVILTGAVDGSVYPFGVVHVKASFAERRSDDVPLSMALIKAGYISPLWTFDAKSWPAAKPESPGECGQTLRSGETDKRSAKRKDLEDDGYFSACFSYNANTKPTPDRQGAKARIFVCTFKNPEDSFSKYIVGEWDRFRKTAV